MVMFLNDDAKVLPGEDLTRRIFVNQHLINNIKKNVPMWDILLVCAQPFLIVSSFSFMYATAAPGN